MPVEFDFHLLQLRYVKAAMASIATYKPDGMNVAAMDSVVTNAGAVSPATWKLQKTMVRIWVYLAIPATVIASAGVAITLLPATITTPLQLQFGDGRLSIPRIERRRRSSRSR